MNLIKQYHFSLTRLQKTIILCFAAVYVIWGSTYLAIRYAIETMPPWTMTSLRFFMASALIWGFAKYKKEMPLGPQEKWVAVVSGLFLILANGIVGMVEQWVPSGFVAVLVGATPIWIMIIGWIAFGHSRPTGRKVLGAVVGLAGVALIASDHFASQVTAIERIGVMVLFVGSWLWTSGTLLQRKVPSVKSIFSFSAYQMFAGACITLLLSLGFEAPWSFSWSSVSASSWLAFGYLVIFGSIIAFTAYAWLSRNVESHLVGTYALVNPIIAVWLGWLLLSEPVTTKFIGATALVVVGLSLLMLKRIPIIKI
jgi:drug/metabolite transporter (DMT)-like permease